MTNALAPISITEMERLAIAVAKSGLFGLKTPDQALALMAISQAEGRHPALAARDYHIIQNTPAKKAEAMLRDFLSAGGKVEWHALTDEIADATFSHPQGGTARISWDAARVAKAQLGGNAMHKKYPRQMLRSRVVSEGVRTIWPMATSGFYVPEEVATFVEEREPIDVTPLKSPTADLDAFAAPDIPALIDRALAAANEGREAWGAFYKSLNADEKNIVKDAPHHWLGMAAEADARVAREGDDDPNSASPHAATERPGAETSAMHGAGAAHTADSVGD